jgi:hypothetical protein
LEWRMYEQAQAPAGSVAGADELRIEDLGEELCRRGMRVSLAPDEHDQPVLEAVHPRLGTKRRIRCSDGWFQVVASTELLPQESLAAAAGWIVAQLQWRWPARAPAH